MTDKQREEWIKEKAERFMFKCPGFPLGDTRAPYLLKNFIRTIYKEIEDTFWAREQYLTDTIKELKKQLDEKKPKVSKQRILQIQSLLLNVAEKETGVILAIARLIGWLQEDGVEVEE